MANTTTIEIFLAANGSPDCDDAYAKHKHKVEWECTASGVKDWEVQFGSNHPLAGKTYKEKKGKKNGGKVKPNKDRKAPYKYSVKVTMTDGTTRTRDPDLFIR